MKRLNLNPFLDGQTMTTFSTATRQYLTAFFGRHTSTETVSTLAFNHAWLECTFHNSPIK